MGSASDEGCGIKEVPEYTESLQHPWNLATTSVPCFKVFAQYAQSLRVPQDFAQPWLQAVFPWGDYSMLQLMDTGRECFFR